MFKKSFLRFLATRRTFYFLVGLGFLFKYWLVLGEEIEPFYRPVDDLIYVQLAESYYWWAEYNGWSFLRPPIFPLYLALVNFTEIPLRIIQELLLCWATYFLINRFRKIGLHASIAGVCFILIIHHPGWLLLANRTLRECFYVSLLFILVAQLVPLANRKIGNLKWHQLVPVGITSALLWYTREETINIAIILFGFVCIFWLLKQELPPWSKASKRLVWISLGLFGPIIVAGLAIRTANYAAHGLFIPHEFAGYSFKKVFKGLMEIKPTNPKPWVSVEQESLELAYSVSPTLSSIRESLSGRTGPRWAAATVNQTNDPEEIAGCAFFFALREAAMEEGIHSDALTAHNFYKKIDEELSAAFKDGRLEKRFVLTSYIDPEISDWITRLPSGLARTASYGYGPLKDTDIRIYYPRHNVFSTLDAYDEVTNRRHYLAYRKVPKIRGWAFIEGKHITSMTVLDHNQVVLDSTTNIYPRPDVAAAYSENDPPPNSGFLISIPKADYPGWDVKVEFKTKEGSKAVIQANRLLQTGYVQDSDETGTILRITVDETINGKHLFWIQETIQAWIWTNYGFINVIFGSLAVFVLLIRIILYKSGLGMHHYHRWILFVILIMGFRALIITLLDISSFRIDLRYIFPAIVFLPLLSGLILQEGITGIKKSAFRW